MYFKAFDFEISVKQKDFIEKLSETLAFYKNALIDPDRVTVTKSNSDLLIYLPHKTEKDLNLYIGMNNREIMISFDNSHRHFDQFFEDEEWISKAVLFVSDLLQGRIEIQGYYKGNKRVREEIYRTKENGERELISTSSFLNSASLNPFIKEREEIKKLLYD